MASNPDPILPPELFRPIIQYLSDDRKTLCAISVTCRMLKQEGQRGLYKKMTHSINVETHIKFLGTILQNNRLALLVEEYCQDTVAHYRRGILWNYLCRGLRAMVNLKILKFRAFGGHPASEILTGCTFQLKGLFWGSHSDEHGLSNFIPYQHDLQGLNVEWDEGKRHLIPSTSCPRLNVLRGNRGALETFLANRRPVSVAWIPQLEDSLNGSVDHLSSELGHLRFFTFGGYFNRPSFNAIYTYLYSVEVLELVGIHDLELSVLSDLKKLRILILSSSWGNFGTPILPNKRPDILGNIFHECKQLQQIHLFIDPKNYQTYQWNAGMLDPQLTFTSTEEVHRWWRLESFIT